MLDEGALSETLRELFRDGRLSKRVRIGVANQRTVLRTLELPPITDRKELDAAVRFQAQEQVPMPLDNAVLDFHALGVHDTPDGPRQQVVLVAAQRDMVGRLLAAVRDAGLRPEGVDLSAFALIRSLYRHDPEHDGRVLYLNVDGLTNMAIAEGAVCRFTRVVGGGLEAMASELAERRSIPVADARELIAAADLERSRRAVPTRAGHARPRRAGLLRAGRRGDDRTTILRCRTRHLPLGGRAHSARERHPRDRRRGAQLAGLPPLPGGWGRGRAGRAQRRRARRPRLRRRAAGGTGRAGHARDRRRGRRRPRRTLVSPQRLAIAAGLAIEEAPR